MERRVWEGTREKARGLPESFGIGGILKPAAFGHDIQGPVLHLIVDAADVLAEDADGDELDAADEKEADGEGGEAGGGVAGLSGEEDAPEEDEGGVGDGGERDDEAE